MIKGVTHAHLGPIWYPSEPSDIPNFSNQFLGRDFFASSYRKMALGCTMLINWWGQPLGGPEQNAFIVHKFRGHP